MKIEVWKGPETPEPEPLRLTMRAEGGVIVVRAVDKYGEAVSRGKLLEITPKGVTLIPSVSPSLGLPLDASQRVQTTSL